MKILSLRWRRAAPVFLLCVLFLAACASVPEAVQAPPQEKRESTAVNAFELVGRVAIKQEEGGSSGGLRWQHSAVQDTVSILSPLGQVVARIERDASGARLTTSDQKNFSAPDAESLTKKILGWSLPLQGLQYWVLGIADPAIPATIERDAQQRISRITQHGWQVNYQRYKGELPDRLMLSYGALEIRLVIDEWHLVPPR